MDKDILILDGGLGTTLEDEHGIQFSFETPLWSSQLLITDQHTLKKAQLSFVDAGADILLTPTYQVSNAAFQNSGITEARPYLDAAINISKEASGGRSLVALSLGAYGATMQPSQEYSGNYDIEQDGLASFHTDRLASFAHRFEDVQLLAFETIPRIEEVKAVKRAHNGSKPYWISCVFPSGNSLPDGTSIQELLPALLADTRPWAIGINCTKVDKVAGLVEEFEEAAQMLDLKLPRLVIYPDGTKGEHYDTTTQKWIGKQDSDIKWEEILIQVVKKARSRGRWDGIVVGGCCRAGPGYIRKLRQSVDELLANTP